jgi:hypothetical protein
MGGAYRKYKISAALSGLTADLDEIIIHQVPRPSLPLKRYKSAS